MGRELMPQVNVLFDDLETAIISLRNTARELLSEEHTKDNGKHKMAIADRLEEEIIRVREAM